MSQETKDLEKKLCELRKLTERTVLLDLHRTIRAAKKYALPVNQVAKFALGAIMEHYELSGDAEVIFKNFSARAPACKAPAVSRFTVSRPKKSVSKNGVRTHKAPTHEETASKTSTTKTSTSKTSTSKTSTTKPSISKAPTKAPTEPPSPTASTAKDPTSNAPSTTATFYKAPAYTAPRDNTPKYELHNFKIPKYKTRVDKAPSDASTDASTVSAAESIPTGENDTNPRKRKASSELSDHPRQRMTSGAAPPAMK